MGIVSGVKRAVKKVASTVKRVVKSVGKAFGKVMSKLPSIAKVALMAVAAYFTFGVALSFIPATQAFAASMPLFSGGGLAGTGIAVGSNPVVAGGGIFSKAAGAMGMGGGLAKGASSAYGLKAGAISTKALGSVEGVKAAVGQAITSTQATAPVTMGAGAQASGVVTAGTEVNTMAQQELLKSQGKALVGKAGGKSAVVNNASGMGGEILTTAGTEGAKKAGMSMGEKLLLASTGLSAVGALTKGGPDGPPAPQGFYGVNPNTGEQASGFAPDPMISPDNPYGNGVGDSNILPPKPVKPMTGDIGPETIETGMKTQYG